MQNIISHFSLHNQGYTQHNVDFLNVYLGVDNRLFLDYNKILQGNSPLYKAMKTDINNFMSSMFIYLSKNQDVNLSDLLKGLHETNATHLGLSEGNPRGKSVGDELKETIFKNLKFLKKAFLKGNLEIDSVYFGIKNIGPDRISDIVTSIVKSRLIEFTRQQCILHSIPMQQVAVSKIFDSNTITWNAGFVQLPTYQNKPIIFIPKDVVSTYSGIAGTFNTFINYGFHNFFKVSTAYKNLVRGNEKEINKDLMRKEFDEYNKEQGINNKDISKIMLTEFDNKDVVNAFVEVRKQTIVLTDDEIVEILNNKFKAAN
ncbi:hypothetical protein [Flavobacterium frigoris]|uniref:Uncharacterized protein n=1 Tax=Flavobacterium frigoris TaxID=229204 RepID=A0A1H9HX20_FLAFI|nr:hypothetical protein [Flavobacterium frigoris]SEQ66933.1 hypothetical protein SAMN05444355_103286 [Flavobacterium frigoris]